MTSAAVHAQTTPKWLLIDVADHWLAVYEGDQEIYRVNDISIGRGGAALLRTRGDAKTPLGQFHVAWINPNSRYHLFFGLDFPNLDYAERAYTTNLIDAQDLSAIREAVLLRETPPQDTDLGGYIGIHGLGNGDPSIHSRFNWTDGCVAVTNQQIEHLARWVTIGTKVVIR